MNVGSLFSGIGGFDLGLERAGMHVVWQCELDPYRRAVLSKHWPNVHCYSDIACMSDVPYVDVVCGGFPCQDLSYAGKGAGIDGTRSGLWSEMLRVIRDVRPRYVIVENVPALLTRGMGHVLGGLAACGFDAEWDCLPASAFGAPHRRDRVWIVAYPRCAGDGSERRGTFEDAPGHGAQRSYVLGNSGADVADTQQQRWDGIHERLQSRHMAPDTGRCGANGTDRTTAADNSGRVSRQGPKSGNELADADDSGWSGRSRQQWSGWRGEPADGGATAADPTPMQRSSLIGNEPNGNDASVGHQWAAEPSMGRVAHGIPNRVDRLSALGDSLVPQIAEWIGRQIIEWERERVAI